MSTDHKPDLKSEKERIEKAGGVLSKAKNSQGVEVRVEFF